MGFCKETIVFLLFFVSSAISTETNTSCGFVPRDFFTGSFIALGDATPSNLTVVIGFNTVVTEITENVVFDSRWVYNAPNVYVSYVASDPQMPQCTNQGVYSTAWINNCGTVTFTLVSDSCAERAQRMNGLTIAQIPSPCVFHRLDFWRGIYPISSNPLTSGLRVEFDLGTKADVNETSSKGVVYAEWSLDPTSRNLLKADVSANPPALACVQEPDARAVYNLVWSRNCTAINVQYIANDCPARAMAYNNMFITQGRHNTPTCSLFSGDVWTGMYGGVAPLAGLPVTFSVGDAGQVVETSTYGTRQDVWSIDSYGDLTIKDVFALPFNFSCGPVTGKYYLDWNQDCSTVVFTQILDGCDLRRQMFNGMTLNKQVPVCKFFPGDTWSGIYPGMDQTRSGATAVLYFGNNYMVNETFSTLTVPLGTVDTRWQMIGDGSIDVRWLGASPESACSPSDEALYIVQWSQECSSAQLHVVYDACPSRQTIYDGFSISRVIPSCQFYQGDSYYGNFPSNNASVNVTVVGLNTATVTTAGLGSQVSWTVDGYGNLVVQNTSDSCNATGLYLILWASNCNSLTLYAITDPCATRKANMNGLVLSIAGPTSFRCRTLPGDSWRGLYQGNDTTFSGRTVTFTFSSMINAMEVSSVGSLAVTWSMTNGVVSVGEIPELTPDQALLCPAYCGKRLSLYNVTWTNDCTQLMLTLVMDSCTRRANTYNGMVLQRVTSPCLLYTSEEWRGAYPAGAGVFAGTAAKVDFGTTSNQLIESAPGVSWTNCWAFNSYSQIAVNTFSSSPPQEDCAANVQGLYAPVFLDNCNTITLWSIYDPCATRAARYESLTLNRQVNTGPACGFRAGDLWDGNFSANARLPFTSADVKVQFTSGTAVFEASSGQTKLGNWFIDRNGMLNVRDTSSKPSPIYACDSGLVAQYDLEWSWDCATVTLTANFDPCERRRNRMDGMFLKKVLSQCRPLRGDIYDAVVPAGKYMGQNLNLTVGASGAVQIQLPTSTVNSRWQIDSNGFLNIVDIASPQCADACDPGVLGVYSAIYATDCNSLTLNVVSDPCTQRLNVLDGLYLVKRYRTVGNQVDVIGFDTETEVQFNFAGMIPPLPCCLAPKDPGCNTCSCSN